MEETREAAGLQRHRWSLVLPEGSGCPELSGVRQEIGGPQSGPDGAHLTVQLFVIRCVFHSIIWWGQKKGLLLRFPEISPAEAQRGSVVWPGSHSIRSLLSP